MKTFRLHPIVLILLGTLFYISLSPFIYFRHDDWLMLGNAVNILPKDWAFLWKPSWFTSPQHEEVWFFRPFFKFIIWLGYRLFSFNSLLWTLTHWSFLVFGTLLGGKALENLTGDSKRSDLFITLVLSSISIHFASIVWVGEGMMNAPQVFLLMLSTYFFSKNRLNASFLSVVFYLFALGFKESSVFLPLFLLSLCFVSKTVRNRQGFLISIFLVMLFFLIFRLGVLPFNPGYKPHFSWETLFKPALYFGCLSVLPLVTLLISHYRIPFYWPEFFKKLIPFLPFLGLLVAPHLGHTFFSPGWFLLPGCFSTWVVVFCLDFRALQKISLLKWGLLIFVLSAIPVIWEINRIEWLNWELSQRKVHQYLKELPDSVTELSIETCPSSQKPEVTFQRVVGSQENLEHLWALHHSRPLKIRLFPCGQKAFMTDLGQETAVMKWIFPDFIKE